MVQVDCDTERFMVQLNKAAMHIVQYKRLQELTTVEAIVDWRTTSTQKEKWILHIT